MRSRWKVTLLVAAAVANAPAVAQQPVPNTNPTETQDRQSDGRDDNLLWNLVGLLGLLGLRGLWRESDNDGYTDDPV
jgi:hypothetical protein